MKNGEVCLCAAYAASSKPIYPLRTYTPRSALLHMGLLRCGLFEAKIAMAFIHAFNPEFMFNSWTFVLKASIYVMKIGQNLTLLKPPI